MAISSSAEGEGAVSVVVDGDRNVVTIQRGGARLVLDQRHKLRAAFAGTAARSELDLLLTERRAIDLVGRDSELASLEAWLASPEPVSFWCVAGRGGAGKTRLGIELCERAEATGWDAGFARDAELKRFYAAQNIGDWRWKNPTLIVVDYAAASLEILRAWLEELAGLFPRAGQPSLRLLLLEREAESATGWWNRLIGEPGLSARGPDRLVANPEPLRLQPIGEAGDRRAILEQVIGQAAGLLGKPAPTLPPAGTNPDFERRLGAGEADKEPLYLAMAGLVAVRDGLASALALDRGQLARQVAANERRRLERLAKSWGFDKEQTLVVHLAACVTLQGGCDAADLEEMIRAEREAGGFLCPLSDAALADRLRDAMPATGSGGTDAIRPDLIGEAFILDELERLPSEEKRTAIVERAWRRDSDAVFGNLVRTAQDFAAFRPDHCSVRWLAHLIEAIDDPGKLVEISLMLPDRTLALREFGAEVAGRVVALARLFVGTNPLASRVLADSLNRYTRRLWDIGRREEALAASREAVDLGRENAALEIESKVELALTLNTYAIMLSETGQPESGLDPAGEAVRIYRELADRQPDDFSAGLAIALINLANLLDDLGRPEEAVAAAGEAVSIRRELASTRSGEDPSDLASTLLNFSNVLNDVGRHEEAVTAIREAVSLFHELAARTPDAFRPQLAKSLAVYASRLGDVRQHGEALAAITEAIDIFRELAGLRPDVFQGELGKALTICRGTLDALDRPQDALAAAQEAVEIHRALALASPDEFGDQLGQNLSHYAISLSRVGRHEDAVVAVADALAIRRPLAAQHPDRLRPGLARELRNYAIVLAEVGRHEEALEAAGEAVAIFREAAASRPERFLFDLANSLCVYADRLEQNRHVAEALAADEEAIGMLTGIFAERPSQFAPTIAGCCREYVERCYRHDREPNMTLLAPINSILQSLLDARKEEN